MGLLAEDAYIHTPTDVSLPNAYMAVRSAQIILRPDDGTGQLSIMCTVPIWKNKHARDSKKSPFAFQNLQATSTVDAVVQRGLYSILYGALKDTAPEFSVDA